MCAMSKKSRCRARLPATKIAHLCQVCWWWSWSQNLASPIVVWYWGLEERLPPPLLGRGSTWRLFYVAHARKTRRSWRVEELDAGAVKNPDSTSFYNGRGNISPSTLVEWERYWKTNLLHEHEQNPQLANIFHYTTQNDKRPEIKKPHHQWSR